jgi:hypothetical protein
MTLGDNSTKQALQGLISSICALHRVVAMAHAHSLEPIAIIAGTLNDAAGLLMSSVAAADATMSSGSLGLQAPWLRTAAWARINAGAVGLAAARLVAAQLAATWVLHWLLQPRHSATAQPASMP